MKILRDINNLNLKNTYIAIGSFDGIHKGHQYLISKMIKDAKKNKHPSVVLTYDPIPRYFINNLKDDIMLTTLDEKVNLISQLNPDYIVIINFTNQIWHMKAYDFLRNVLVAKLDVQKIFIGKNHHFGYNREGTPEFIKSYKDIFSFDIEIIEPLFDHHSKKAISSSLIRKLLCERVFSYVLDLLAHPYLISGTVIHGKGIGKNIGIPTANISVEKGKLLPPSGVYPSKVKLENKIYNGALAIGIAPTIKKEKTKNIELHIFNFNDNIYSYKIELYLIKYLRKEMFFDSKEKLINEINKDIKQSKDILKEVTEYGFKQRG
ncbi:bifunctional riboflavin kinase/FAD synthetase [candidate division WOR-3 bacterium]|nr:bifunctional riboflavin kinase/FAD synthetase [candidate division WOR-3 bacterium]